MTTIGEDSTLHSAPLTILASSNGEKLVFAQATAEKTPNNMEYMKEKGIEGVVVIQFAQYVSRTHMEGYSINVKIQQKLTEGPLFEQYKETIQRQYPMTPLAIWELTPTGYKDHSFGPSRGKCYSLT
jgi:hypothetical protein